MQRETAFFFGCFHLRIHSWFRVRQGRKDFSGTLQRHFCKIPDARRCFSAEILFVLIRFFPDLKHRMPGLFV